MATNRPQTNSLRYSLNRPRAPTSPKTGAPAFIPVLPWRINDGRILSAYLHLMVAVILQSLHDSVTKLSRTFCHGILVGCTSSPERAVFKLKLWLHERETEWRNH